MRVRPAPGPQRFLPALAVLALPAVALARAEIPREATTSTAEDDLPFELSLPTIADREAWLQPGFRLELGYGYGEVWGLAGAPAATSHTLLMRAGTRLDESWSLLASFTYGIVSGDMVGVRFAGTIDPTWHLGNWHLAVGAGFAGIVEGRTERNEQDGELRDSLVATYTYPDNDKLLPNCSGTGLRALARGGWTAVIGPLAATSLALEVDGQWTVCEEETGRFEPDTALPIGRRQWWGNLGASLLWTVGWR